METNNPNFNTNLQIFSNQNPQIELNANTEQTAQQHEHNRQHDRRQPNSNTSTPAITIHTPIITG